MAAPEPVVLAVAAVVARGVGEDLGRVDRKRRGPARLLDRDVHDALEGHRRVVHRAVDHDVLARHVALQHEARPHKTKHEHDQKQRGHGHDDDCVICESETWIFDLRNVDF